MYKLEIRTGGGYVKCLMFLKEEKFEMLDYIKEYSSRGYLCTVWEDVSELFMII